MGFFSDLNNNTFTEDDPTVVINPLETVEGQLEEGLKEEANAINEESQTSSVKENLSTFQETFSKNESNVTHPDVKDVLNQMEQATSIQDDSKNISSTKEEMVEQEISIESMMPMEPTSDTPIVKAITRSIVNSSNQKTTARKLVTTSGTVISSDATIEGNITLNSNITVLGTITGFLRAGDVTLEAEGNVLGGIEGETVTIEGKVDGDVRGTNVTIGNCKIKGNIYASNTLLISNKATVVGNVTNGEGDVTIFGRIKGDVESTGTVVLKAGAIVKGNITAMEVLIDKGTTFQGAIFKAGEIDDSIFESNE